MRLVFLVTLLGVACILSSALPVRDEDETSEELLQENSDEKLLSVLQSAHDVSEPSSNDVDTNGSSSSSSDEEQRRKRLVTNLEVNDESNSYSREADDKTILKHSEELREKRKAEFDFIGTRISKQIHSEESSEEDNTKERLRRSLEPVNVDSDSDESHPRHDELRLRNKRGAKDSSSGEDSAQKKDKNTSEDSSEENAKKNKQKLAQLQPLAAEEKTKDGEEVQALRRKRQAAQLNSPEERLRRSLEPVNVDSDSDESHPRHDELRLRNKRGAKDSSSGEDSAQKKDKNTSEDSSEENAKKNKQKLAQLQPLAAEEKPKDGEEVQALRRKRQAAQPNSSEAKSTDQRELSEELTDLETVDDIVQKETDGDVENSEETIVDTEADDDNEAALAKLIEDKKPDVNSVEDYVQGCEVMEPDSNEANETTYITDKR